MSVFCVTGPMAAGKNFICAQYEKQGWLSIDCDVLVHSAVEECRDEIIQAFGEEAKNKGIELLCGDGKINRRNLGVLIFGDEKLLKKQEGIVHPYVVKKVRDFVESNPQRNILINATVLYKTPELMNLCEKIIFVRASRLKRFVRARRRDHLSVAKIIQRFRAQRHLLREYKATGKPVEIVRNG